MRKVDQYKVPLDIIICAKGTKTSERKKYIKVKSYLCFLRLTKILILSLKFYSIYIPNVLQMFQSCLFVVDIQIINEKNDIKVKL